MRTLVIGLAMAAMVGGCASEPTVFRLVGFDDDETAEVRSAMSEWCHVSGDNYCPSIGESDSALALFDDMANAGNCRVRSTMVLSAPVSTILVHNRRDLTDWLPRLRRTVLHELGHAAGCEGHISDGNVMAANEDDEPYHLTYADAKCAIGN
jgi:hypothetical protein